MQSLKLAQKQKPKHVFHDFLQKFEDMSTDELELVNPVTLMIRITPRLLTSKYVYWAALIQGKTNSFAWGSFKKSTHNEVKIRGMCRVNGWGLKSYNKKLADQDFVVVSSGANFKGMLADFLKGPVTDLRFETAMSGLASKAGHDIKLTEKNIFNRSKIHKNAIEKKLHWAGEHDVYVRQYLDEVVGHILDYIVRNKKMQEHTQKYCMEPEECQIRPSYYRAKHKWSPREFNEYLACSQWTYGSSMFEPDDDQYDTTSFKSDDDFLPDAGESIL